MADDEGASRRTLHVVKPYSGHQARPAGRNEGDKKRPPLKGHEAFLKALELSNADVVVEKCDGVIYKGKLRHSDKHTITRRTVNGELAQQCDRHYKRTDSDPHMFGSDIKHGQRIKLSIQRAEHHRNLSNDWYHGAGVALIEVELSLSQFAEFITTPNRGEGIPCTITAIKGELISAIDQVETKQEMFRREIEAMAAKRLAGIAEKIDPAINTSTNGSHETRHLCSLQIIGGVKGRIRWSTSYTRLERPSTGSGSFSVAAALQPQSGG